MKCNLSDPNPKGDYYLRINNLRDEYIFRRLNFNIISHR